MSRVALLKRAVYNTVETVLARVGTTINISADEAAFGRRKHKVPLNRRQIIPNPVDTTCFQPASPEQRQAARARFGLAENDEAVGLIARMCWQKDPETAYHGIAKAARRHPNLRFLHIGWGKWNDFLLGLARTHGFADRLQILDYSEDTTPFFHAIDALLISSRYEAGWPFVALEALACNLPVICATCPGMSDMGRAGLSHVYPFTPEDPAGCARAIEAWLSQREPPIGACNHRAYAIKNFSLEACFGDVLKFYRAQAAVAAPARARELAQSKPAEQTL
jgi:glycosyltransferase involved in cell wall biosynthesis